MAVLVVYLFKCFESLACVRMFEILSHDVCLCGLACKVVEKPTGVKRASAAAKVLTE